MNLIVAMTIITTCLIAVAGAKSTKKLNRDEAILTKKLTGKFSSKPSPPAIIAIEIVDPNENKTSKNSKRTIESSLGYGYQNFFGGPTKPQPPRYEVYKYSQHDIPAYRNNYQNNFNVQKSVSYNLPTQFGNKYTNVVPSPPNLANYYQPGTTLFSTVNSHGQIGGLTQQIPQQYNNNNNNQEPQVPVIILRVLPSQLNDPSAVLHPNLPQSHPLASTLNNVNLQSLLNQYVQQTVNYQQPYQSTPQQHYQQSSDEEPEQQGYHYDPPQYQYLPQQQQLSEEINHQQQQQQQYQSPSSNDLLTHENYPKNTHTRVIFHKNKNSINNYNAETAGAGDELSSLIPQGPSRETKTIQVTVPHGAFSSVQVETPESKYSYSNQGSNNNEQQNYYYNSNDNGDDNNNYYYSSQQPQEYQSQGESQKTDSYEDDVSGGVYEPNQVDERTQQYGSYQGELARKQRSRTISSSPQRRFVFSSKVSEEVEKSTGV